MSELKKHPVEPMEGHENRRIWLLTLRRNRALDALSHLSEMLAIYPEEAKRLDVFGLESKMNAIREACRKDEKAY